MSLGAEDRLPTRYRVVIGHGIVSNQLLIRQERTNKLASKIEGERLAKKKKLELEVNSWVSYRPRLPGPTQRSESLKDAKCRRTMPRPTLPRS